MKGFKPKYEITDGPFMTSDHEVFLFGIASVSEDLRSYVNWDIVAASVQIENAVLLNVKYRNGER